ncbi:hypothetical protein LWHH1689_1542 [Limosilactobacillus reuteri]|uniref:YfhO family protein n=1 Tax=Limosilactobacillus reuteri TaxID=1598 RepID=A0A2S1ES86_LIMRT|nr:hypothetical protein [Limosilactobacillus reuteri]AWD62830.1 hypothetical protein LWHH1689_1542 [Limosilactobacillus reuteri]
MLNLIQPLTLIIGSSVDSVINANSIGLFLIITCLFGWIFLGKIEGNSKIYVSIYLLGLLFLILASSSFPWYLFEHSILGTIQIPYRYLEFSAFFFAIIFAKPCFIFFMRKLNLTKSFAITTTIIITLFSYWVPVKEMYTKVEDATPTQFQKIKNSTLPASILNKDNYNDQFNCLIQWGETDYYPQSSIAKKQNCDSIIKGIIYANDKKITNVNIKYLPNTIIYKITLPSPETLNLPCVAYHNTYVKVNGEKIDYKISSRGTVLIPHSILKSRKIRVEVGFDPGMGYYLCIVITICAWIIILITGMRRKKNAEEK